MHYSACACPNVAAYVAAASTLTPPQCVGLRAGAGRAACVSIRGTRASAHHRRRPARTPSSTPPPAPRRAPPPLTARRQRVHHAPQRLKHLQAGAVHGVGGRRVKHLQAPRALVQRAAQLLVQDHLRAAVWVGECAGACMRQRGCGSTRMHRPAVRAPCARPRPAMPMAAISPATAWPPPSRPAGQ